MQNKEIVLQIFTGGYNKAEAAYEEIEQKLLPLLEKTSVKKVIIGWAVQKELYKKLGELLHNYSVEYYLWVPVFSETGELKPATRLVDFAGNEVENYQLKEGENFEFYCPNLGQNSESFLEIYEEHFSDLGFDGVFLDKIRYGAFSNGISGVFSCFCPECQRKYKQKGLNIAVLKNEMWKVFEGTEGYDEKPLKVNAYKNGAYTFENPVWEKFFDIKGQMLYEALKPICDFFRDKNMKVGMDTFSPFTSYFAGQNIEKLNGLADFIKPMMYRITNAPAGLPFETKRVIQETCNGNETAARGKFFEVIECQDNGEKPFALEFVKKELDFMKSLGGRVYCGVEINRIDEVAPSTPEYVKENLLELSKTDIDGFVLSWNLLSAPQENIDVVVGCMDTGR